MFLIAALLVAALWWIYNRTDIGLQARATMQNPAMARALGVDTRRIYMMTFTLGAALAGLSGALLAPTTSIMPFMGQQFVAPAFITVVVGGATNVIAGAVGSSLLLSLVKTPVGFFLGPPSSGRSRFCWRRSSSSGSCQTGSPLPSSGVSTSGTECADDGQSLFAF